MTGVMFPSAWTSNREAVLGRDEDGAEAVPGELEGPPPAGGQWPGGETASDLGRRTET